jgi:hypothetical protein
MNKEEANQRVDALLRAEQAALRGLPYGDLVELPAHAQREIDAEGRPAILSTYRDLLPDDAVRVVSQYYRKGPLGTARVRAEGFLMAADGVVRDLAESELWDFT